MKHAANLPNISFLVSCRTQLQEDSSTAFEASIKSTIMIPCLFLLFVASTVATNASTTLRVPPYTVRCVETPTEPHTVRRRNPLAVDCLNVATFVLVTNPFHADPVQVLVDATAGQVKTPWSRISGTCEIELVLTPRGTKGPDTTSFDEIVRIVLELVGKCLLNNGPLAAQWGGTARFGINRNIRLLLSGTRRSGEAGGALGNETLALGDFDSLFGDLTQS